MNDSRICKICGIAKCEWDACDACEEAAKEDLRVKAIHDHKLVGRGSLTSIDECYDDHELVLHLNEVDANTVKKAIEWALESEGLWREQATNCRWGEDSDPQLKDYRDWKESLQENHHPDCTKIVARLLGGVGTCNCNRNEW